MILCYIVTYFYYVLLHRIFMTKQFIMWMIFSVTDDNVMYGVESMETDVF